MVRSGRKVMGAAESGGAVGIWNGAAGSRDTEGDLDEEEGSTAAGSSWRGPAAINLAGPPPDRGSIVGLSRFWAMMYDTTPCPARFSHSSVAPRLSRSLENQRLHCSTMFLDFCALVVR